MMGVIGIDADRARIAVVRHVGTSKAYYTIDRMNAAGRITEGYSRALGHLMEKAQGKAVIFLEGIYLPRKGNPLRDLDTYRVLANVQGELLYEAARFGVDVRLVPPMEWQTRVLGFCTHREKIKEASRAEARRMFGAWNLTEHESDAACLCQYGRWVLRNEEGAA